MADSEIQRRPEQLEKEIKALEWRDLQLWGIGACVLFALAAGFFPLLAPNLLWKFTDSVHAGNLPQYTAGLIVLLLLLNAQTLHQRFRLQKTRAELVRQLQLAERAAQVDALTGVFNRRYMEKMLEKEVSRAERYQNSLCLAVIDVDKFKDFNTRFGHLEGDRVLMAVASLMRKTSGGGHHRPLRRRRVHRSHARNRHAGGRGRDKSAAGSLILPGGTRPTTAGIPSPSRAGWPNLSRE